MYAHHQAKVIFLAHPRTASVATATALQKIGFEKWGGDHHLRLWSQSPPRSSPALPDPRPNGNEIVTPATRKEWLVFTTIRNPYDAAVSWVFRRFKIRRDRITFTVDDFRTALEYNHWVETMLGPKKCRFWGLHTADADVVMRYECLNADLAAVLRSRGLQAIQPAHHNVSQYRYGRPYRDFYTPETRAYVESLFLDEIEDCGYEF